MAPTQTPDNTPAKTRVTGWRKPVGDFIDSLRGHSSNSERLAWAMVLLPIFMMVGGFWVVGLVGQPPQAGHNAPLVFTSNPAVGPQIILMLIAGLSLMAVPGLIQRAAGKPRPLILLIVILSGLGLRLLTLGSAPFYENDFFRYLWDGSLFAKGISPYWHAPIELTNPGLVMRDSTADLMPYVDEASDVLANINHPWLATIYPPIAQVFFAAANLIAPYKIDGLRIVFTAVDLFNLYLILLVLKRMDKPLLWSALYWVNPLVIGEVFNSAHMDVLIFPFLLLALLFAAKRWTFLAVAFLAAATAVKVWPILLLPLILRKIWSANKLKALRDFVWFFVVTTILLLPMLIPIFVELSAGFGGPAPASGTAAYTKTWQMNDSLYQVALWLTGSVMAMLPFVEMPTDPSALSNGVQTITRLIIAGIVGITALIVALPKWERIDQVITRTVIVIAVMFFLSPTQFPWYALWFLPFLPFVPVRGLMILSGTMVIYYVRPYFAAMDAGRALWIYDIWFVWLIFIPAFLLLLRDLFVRR